MSIFGNTSNREPTQMRVGFGDSEIDFLDHDQIAVLATSVG